MADDEKRVQGGDGAGSETRDAQVDGAPPAVGANGAGTQGAAIRGVEASAAPQASSVNGAAPQVTSSPASSVNGARPPTPAPAENGAEERKEPSEAIQIGSYLEQGYSPRQIVSMGFARETVRDQAARRMKPEGNKLAKAGQSSGSGDERPFKLLRSEIIPPEEALRGIRLQDGEYKLGFTDGIRVLLMAVRLTQELATVQSSMMDPTIRMVQSMREEERIAAEHARGSGEAIAKGAAEQAAGQIAGYFEQRLARIEEKAHAVPPSPNPMADMMARVMEPLLKNLMGAFLGGTPGGQEGQQGQRSVPGFTYEQAKGGAGG